MDYHRLVAAIREGAFPHERHWIDFKRRLYPADKRGESDGAARDKVHEELARDLASMSERGGFLVYGVKEDKARHTFTVDEMDLPVGLHETVDSVARSRVTPPLSVMPTLVMNPEEPTRGLMVVEVPDSPDAPHMVDHVYWGRCETGRVRLRDDQIERLMLRRQLQSDRLLDALQATIDLDPVSSDHRAQSHFYLTAVPAQGWPEMFTRYTGDYKARGELIQRCGALLREISAEDRDRPASALSGLIDQQRVQRVPSGWMKTWAGAPNEGCGRTVGVDDDGPVRYINLGASMTFRDRNLTVLLELNLLYETRDMIRLVTALSHDVGYTGRWQIGVHLDRLTGHGSQLADPNFGYIVSGPISYDAPSYQQSASAPVSLLQEEPDVTVERLMRSLLRGLGTEFLLSTSPFAKTQQAGT